MNPQKDLLTDGALSMNKAAKFTGYSRAFLYNACNRGELPFITMGRTRRIPKRALMDFMARGLQGGWAITEPDRVA
jgi:excisionase family DNA binding protein